MSSRVAAKAPGTRATSRSAVMSKLRILVRIKFLLFWQREHPWNPPPAYLFKEYFFIGGYWVVTLL
jgi:hypothetical protein